MSAGTKRPAFEAMTKRHELKTWPAPFAAVLDGRKRFEFRKDDRGFEVGDELDLREWDPESEEGSACVNGHSGRHLRARVLYLVRGPAFGVPAGFVVMSIAKVGSP